MCEDALLPRARVFSLIPYVLYCKHRVMDDHAGTRKAHDLSHLLSHPAAIAVNCAFGTRGLVILERALFNSLHRIRKQRLALRAQRFRRSVLVPAIDLDHDLYRLPFPIQPIRLMIHDFSPRASITPMCQKRVMPGQKRVRLGCFLSSSTFA